jgi:hypothetical protein
MRKPIQIAMRKRVDEHSDYLIVVCDDGTIWEEGGESITSKDENGIKYIHFEWYKINNVPQEPLEDLAE